MCGGLTLAEQMSTKPVLSLSSLAGQGRNNITNLWAKVRTGKDHSPVTIMDKVQVREISLLAIKSVGRWQREFTIILLSLAPSFFLDTTPQRIFLPFSSQWCWGMGSGSYSQFIPRSLCCSILLRGNSTHIFPCSSVGSLPWETVLY